jgi:class 3 adenylate cyclase
MEATHKSYSFLDSLGRMDEILDSSNKLFEEKDSIPARSELTYINGFYVNCTALFVDICDSSKMTDEHKRPVLAKIYRSFISELVAFFNGFDICKEVNIHGDCVWAVFDTPYKHDIDTAFSAAYGANALVNILNYKLKKRDYLTYKVGIGMDYGRALMIKAGHKGSTINDVVWMGDVVNEACHLAGNVGKPGMYGNNIFLTSNIHSNLNDDNKELCSYNNQYFFYQSSAVMSYMDNWLTNQKEEDKKKQSNNGFGLWGY